MILIFLALLAEWVTLALLVFWAVLVVNDMALSNSLCCFSINNFLLCSIFSKHFTGWLKLSSVQKFIQSYRIYISVLSYNYAVYKHEFVCNGAHSNFHHKTFKAEKSLNFLKLKYCYKDKLTTVFNWRDGVLTRQLLFENNEDEIGLN